MGEVSFVPSLLASSFFVFLIWKYLGKPRESPALRSVAILVLGDVGRSPRMMYHAESFAKLQFETYLVGYEGSKPVPSLLSVPHVHFLYLHEPPAALRSLPFIILAPFKILHQIYAILSALLWRMPHPPEFILVQNPPSIPTLALVYLVSRLRGSKVIIDWHNLGYSILALKLGQSHVFVRIAKMFEAYFGRSAYAHLFVTRAMRDFLVREWGLQGQKAVLHDRPPSHFHRASPSETHELFLRLEPLLPTAFLPPHTTPYSTALTHVTDTPPSSPSRTTGELNMPSLRADRPAIVVTSTSWTEDEDFGMMIDALEQYELRAREVNKHIGDSALDQHAVEKVEEGGLDTASLPKLLMIVTGKGPLKEKYMSKVHALQNAQDAWKWVHCTSLWLEPEDYPLLLGSADLGISLHASSSALDLPMKVVDMFGCGLPVCALDFACLSELVKDGKNGLIFTSAAELAEQLEDLLGAFPHSPALATLREALDVSTPHSASPHSHLFPQYASYATHSQGGASDAGSDTDADGQEEEEEAEEEWDSWDANWARIVGPLVLKDAAWVSY